MRFASVKLRAIREDMSTEEYPSKYIDVDKDEFKRIQWWNRMMYRGMHPSPDYGGVS